MTGGNILPLTPEIRAHLDLGLQPRKRLSFPTEEHTVIVIAAVGGHGKEISLMLASMAISTCQIKVRQHLEPDIRSAAEIVTVGIVLPSSIGPSGDTPIGL